MLNNHKSRQVLFLVCFARWHFKYLNCKAIAQQSVEIIIPVQLADHSNTLKEVYVEIQSEDYKINIKRNTELYIIYIYIYLEILSFTSTAIRVRYNHLSERMLYMSCYKNLNAKII